MHESPASPAPASRTWRLSVGLVLLTLAGWVALPSLRPFVLTSPAAPGQPAPTPAAPDAASESGAAAWRPVAMATATGATSEPAGGHVFRHAIPEPGQGRPEQQPVSAAASVTPTPPVVAPGLSDGLPPVPAQFGAPPPAFTDRYRTTLRMPPPPLLDPRHAVSVVRTQRTAAAVVPPRAAGVHVVHDGDDLTGIALRFYGNPAMADVILAANRDRLRDPAILPIGLQLQLPAVAPAAETSGLPAGRSAWLEPPSG